MAQTRGTCRWCPTHQRALQPPDGTRREGSHDRLPGHWRPLAPWMLRLALAYAGAYSCREQITVTQTPCDRCEGAEEGSHDVTA